MKTIILCGGNGIRLRQEQSYIPKAMVRLGERPLVWHIMKRYSFSQFTDFVMALGYKGDKIRDYFCNYDRYTSDIAISLAKGSVTKLTEHQETDWNITLVDTGNEALSGARIHRLKQYIDEKEFMVTYSDCVANVNISSLLDFHHKHKKVATITGVIPPYRIGDFTVKNNIATGNYDPNNKKDQANIHYINGGYMVFNTEIFSYLSSFNECSLEKDIFSKLIKNKELAIYPHHGFWKWLDTDRDFEYLHDLVDKNKMYWLQE